MLKRNLTALLFAAAVLSAGCTVKSLDNAIFACRADDECADDEACLEGLCRSPSSLSDGGPIVGHCATDCSAERKMCCGTQCVDLASDDNNCGVCGKTCQSKESCVAGKCSLETSCNNGLDDNNDGLIDCADTASCPEQTTCSGGGRCCNRLCAIEADDTLCSNGTDDDCNGKSDCADTGCYGRQCATGAVCDMQRNCVAGCHIDGRFVNAGTPSPSASCTLCNPTRSVHDWTPVNPGTMTEGCKTTRACNDTGECRRAAGQPCGSNGDCASRMCTANICL